MVKTAFYRIIPLALGAFTAALDNNILNVCLPLLAAEMHGDAGLAQFVASAYTFTICSLLLLFTYLSPAVGRRNVFCGGISLFAVGSVLAALAGGLEQLIFSRIVQGVGAAMFMANGMALVNTHFDRSVKGRAFGIMSSAIAVASMAGPILGGAIAAHFSWRAIFYALVPLALVAAVSARVLLQPEQPTVLGRINGKGMAASSVSVLAFFGSFVLLQQHLIMAFAAMFCVSLGLAYYFIKSEGAVENPLFGQGLLTNGIFLRANISATSVYAVMLGYNLVLPFYALNTLHLSVVETGWLMAIPAGAIFILSYSGGRWADRQGGAIVVQAGLSLLAVSMLLLLAGVYFARMDIIGAANVVFGAGMGIFNPANNKIVMESVPFEQAAAAGSINVLGRNAGIAVGMAITGISYAALLSAGYNCTTALLLIIAAFLMVIGALMVAQRENSGTDKVHLKIR